MSGVSQPLNVRILGDGPRRVLAIHCTIAHSGVWRKLSEEFEDCTFVAPDMLSHGRSPDWDRQGDFQDRMIEAVLPSLTEPMDVIGHSFGGTLALRLAVELPDLVRTVTMVEPVFFAVAAIDDPAVFQQDQNASAPVFEAFEQGDEALAARRFNRMWGDEEGPRWDDLPDQTRNAMMRGVHIVQASGPAVMDRTGILEPGVLDCVTIPALLVRGALSPPIVQVVNDGLVRRLPNAANAVIEGAGHMVPITHAAETARHLRDLFDRAAV